MHAVFLSEPVIQIRSSFICQTEIDVELLVMFKEKHRSIHFDILPSCPSCLERLDSSLSGLQ